LIKFWQNWSKQEAINTLHSEIHKLISSIWNKEKFPHRWKEPITVPIYKKDDKTHCSDYRQISLLPTTNKMLSNILWKLTPYIDKIIDDYHSGFQCTSPTTDHIFQEDLWLCQEKSTVQNSHQIWYTNQTS
jgi:hypothetical protein